jgi:pyruvate/2-oxoglutarate dehydrogenase complex dihydrolipoamide dehydrogenase (E3) component
MRSAAILVARDRANGRGRAHVIDRQFDAIVVGMGPGGEVVADRLIDAGLTIAVVERELIGGECGYWGCIPSKTLLRPGEVARRSARTAGVAPTATDWPAAAAYRDEMIRHLRDGAQVDRYRERGAEVVKGVARLTGPGSLVVEGEGQTHSLLADHIVLATGTTAVIPKIDGLDAVPVWTNREATTMSEPPERVAVLGGGPIGVELSQMMARFGSSVTLIEAEKRVLANEDPRPGELAAQGLVADGVEVLTGRRLTRAEREGGDTILTLDDGSAHTVDVVLVAVGRRPRIDDLGLDSVGISARDGALAVDARCALAPGLWAVGDVTGVMPFTHVAKYQARVVVTNILGGTRDARYDGIPRVVFTDPQLAACGLTEAEARDAGIDLAVSHVDLAETTARPVTYERDPTAELCLFADRARGVLVGAWAVGPMASEWIHMAALAIRAAIPIASLRDVVPQFPTYSEGYLTALETLDV